MINLIGSPQTNLYADWHHNLLLKLPFIQIALENSGKTIELIRKFSICLLNFDRSKENQAEVDKLVGFSGEMSCLLFP